MTPLLTKPKPGAIINPLHPLARGLIGCWLFNEGSGSNVYDISGKGNHGKLTNMAVNSQSSGWNSSKLGGGLCFDDSYVEVDSTKNMNATNNLSVCAWIKPKSTGSTNVDIIVEKMGSVAEWQFSWGNTDELRFYAPTLSPTVNYTSTSPIVIDVWSHVVCVLDGTNISFSVNGINVGTYSMTGSIVNQNDGLMIGRYQHATGYNYRGCIDHVRVYNRTLLDTEVKQLYKYPFADIITPSVLRLYAPAAEPAADPKPTIPTTAKPKPGATLDILNPINNGLVGCWLVNEGSGSSLYDISEKGNHGTCSGQPNWKSSIFGGSLEFDVTDDTVLCGNNSSLDLETPFSVSFWMNSTSTNTYQSILERGAGSGTGYEIFFSGSTNNYIRMWDGTSVNSDIDSILPNTGWHHVIIVSTGGYVYFYIDGIYSGGGSETINTSGSNNFYIGSFQGNDEYFGGKIDNIRVYNRALLEPERNNLFKKPFEGIATQKTYLYYLEELTGWTGTINGVTNPAKIYGIPVANIVKVSGVE